MSDVPNTFNGEPTQYRLFDGFLRANMGMKAVYAGSLLLGGFSGFGVLVPAAMEASAYSQSRSARRAAQYAQQNPAPAYPAASPSSASPDLANAPLITPSQGTCFQDAVAQQRATEAASLNR